MRKILFISGILLASSGVAFAAGVSLFKDTLNTSVFCQNDEGSLDCSYYDLMSVAQSHAKSKGGEYLGYDINVGIQNLRDGKNDISITVKYLK